jgi:hypothetical protein
MNWHIGEIAVLEWDMSEDGFPAWVTTISVRVIMTSSTRVTVRSSPETERGGWLGEGLAALHRRYSDVEWHFDPQTGEQLPGTKHKYNARLRKLKQTQN